MESRCCSAQGPGEVKTEKTRDLWIKLFLALLLLHTFVRTGILIRSFVFLSNIWHCDSEQILCLGLTYNFCVLFYKFHVKMILMHHENALSYYLKESQFNGNHSLFKASHISELKLCGTFSQAKLSQSLLMLQRSSPDVTSPWQAVQHTIRAWLICSVLIRIQNGVK